MQEDFCEDRFGADAEEVNMNDEHSLMSTASVGGECPLSDLDELREQIGYIDGHLLDLLVERAELSREIALVKKQEKLPIEDKGREAELIAIQKALAEDNNLDPDYIEDIWEIIIKHSKKIQVEKQRDTK